MMGEIELEAPAADAAEQSRDAIPVPRDSGESVEAPEAPLEADAADSAEQAAGDNRRSISGQRCAIGPKVTQEHGNESAGAPHTARPPRNRMRCCGKQATSTTHIVAPITVPIMRNHPLRKEAPSCG